MLKKFFIIILILFAFGVSIYLYGSNLALEATGYGPLPVILFSIPFTMIIVNSSLFFLPKMIKTHSSYLRYKKGFESIFLSLSLILALLHFGFILLVLGIEVNFILLVPLSVGIVLITTANTLPRFQLEISRTSSELTQSAHQAWNIAVRPLALPLIIGGLTMLFCVFLPPDLVLIGFFLVLICTLLISIFLSYKAYQIHVSNL
ncbi:hypothetical protein QUF73_14705 [Cytobacillus sp. NJ13]|nr:hypothetical protein [Cytobacillus sp. NJ13]